MVHGQIWLNQTGITVMDEASFSSVVELFSAPDCELLRESLASMQDLDKDERDCIVRSAERSMHSNAYAATLRVLVLEMHAAKLTGALKGEDPVEQFRAFLRHVGDPAFIGHLRSRYVLVERLGNVLANKRAAIEEMTSRMLLDRERLARHFGKSCDKLTSLELELGDSHLGGRAVAKLGFADHAVMYKPRPMRLDETLDTFLGRIFPEESRRIRLPETMDCGHYGWAAFVTHRHCQDDAELGIFYRGMGHWIAVMHLLSGTDIHCDNLIAVGCTPVVIDPECLFARACDALESPQGAAYAEAARTIASSILRTSIVPYRLPYAAFKGVDISSVGAAMGQKVEAMTTPSLVNDGTTDAYLGSRPVEPRMAQSMPSLSSSFIAHKEDLIEGWLEATRRLKELDCEGELGRLLEAFEGCVVRDMFRTTQFYLELRHLLWHPVSLHSPEKARTRAMGILTENPGASALVPGQIDDELARLEERDIPAFRSGATLERVMSSLERWRKDDIDRQEMILRGSLLAADLNARAEKERGIPVRSARKVEALPDGDREELRHELLEKAVRRLLRFSLRATDGSMTWIGTALGSNGWVVEPIRSDFYAGIGGIAFALAGYRHEVACGRAEAVDGLQDVLEGCLATMRGVHRAGIRRSMGGFNGVGAEVWQWLLLADLLGRPELVDFAVECADFLSFEGLQENDEPDLLTGEAGLIVPLIHLADATEDDRWLDVARTVGNRLDQAAVVGDGGTRWNSASFDTPIGGFAHGATGIGWALARLSLSRAGSMKERQRWSEVADGAFHFEALLYQPSDRAWRDLRMPEQGACSDAWCHGGIGIGMAASDLFARTGRNAYLETMQVAVSDALEHGWREDVSLCHGSLGMRELVARSADLGIQERHVLDEGDRAILSAVAGFLGGTNSMAMELFVPGLMTGLSGVIFGLCQMHPACSLPSPLLMELKPGASVRREAARASG
jgi:type 2 lantibiotic biosynthesis protein LanM